MYNTYSDSEICLLFDHIENSFAYADALDMWYEDVLSVNTNKGDLLFAGNSVLEYWNSDNVLIDVQYSNSNKCYMWTVLDAIIARQQFNNPDDFE